MGKTKFQKQVQPDPNPCLHCPNPPAELPMDARIAVGFGYAALHKDSEVVWAEGPKTGWEDAMTVAEAEKVAAKDPDHDWRIIKDGPMHGETYQRQGKAKWVCIEQNQGFA